MKILTLHPINFKGLKDLTLSPAGADLNVFGPNGIGKTTIADSCYWLLFDKNSENKQKFDIKPLDKHNKPILGLNPDVEGEFEIDGNKITLRKVLEEDWTQKRGNVKAEFRGFTTKYFVNQVPVSETVYKKRVSEICSEEQFRMLTDPTYFPTKLSWQDQRRILLDVCGDITDADVIATKKELKDLPVILGQHSLDEFREICLATRKKIGEELGSLPTRIDEATKAIPDIVCADYSDAIETHRKAIQALQEKRAQVSAGGATADKVVRLRQIEGELIAIANRVRIVGPERDAACVQAHKLSQQIAEAKDVIGRLESKIKLDTIEVESLDKRIDNMRLEFRTIFAKEFEPTETCFACGGPLPPDKIAAQLASFNESKAKSLTENREKGQALANEKAPLLQTIEKAQARLTTTKEQLARFSAEHAAIVIPEAKVVDPVTDPEYQAKYAEKLQVQSEIEALQGSTVSAIIAIDAEITEVQTKLQEVQRAAAQVDQKRALEARIADLQKREKELNAQFEELVQNLFLTEEFIRTKVRMLTNKINSRFKITTFKLFIEQVNGGLKECCDPMIGGCPYNTAASHSERLKIGLDIINTLSEHYGFAPFVFVDDAESCTFLPATHGQQIRLYVTSTHPKHPDQPLTEIYVEPAIKQAQEALI